MASSADDRDHINQEIARRWCAMKGENWSVRDQAGRGGTAPVFGLQTPLGERALKIYDSEFSDGHKGTIEEKRVEQQVALGSHNCTSLIRVYEGGRFENRLFLLMDRAPGSELEKLLDVVPRNRIRSIVDQVARACIFLREKGVCHRDIKSANIFISDDFERVTLLDLSVTRGIYDPLGMGTDHDGQLPVVATARYSPPEYLFRLLEPGPQLWHALDIYQLGGLLHDLIMRKPLFEKEYGSSKENRYRFAWVIATTDPVVAAADVDQDLVFTARRALDKDWERRSLLNLSDFLAEAETKRVRALDAIGLSRKPLGQSEKPAILRRLGEISSALEARIQEYLMREGAIAHHFNDPGVDDRSKLLRFEWPPSDRRDISGNVIFKVVISLIDAPSGRRFESTAMLAAVVNGTSSERLVELPAVDDSAGTNDRLGEQIEAALGALAAALLSQPDAAE